MLTASVVIPTYDREEAVLRLLGSLATQVLPGGAYEVIVVDDGSSTGLPRVANEQYPFSLRLLRQENAGATAARNTGAAASQGSILVFIDDDMALRPGALAALVDACANTPDAIVLGTLVTPEALATNVYGRLQLEDETPARASANGLSPAHFSKCKTGVLAIQRETFMALGMFHDPGRGWANGDDEDSGPSVLPSAGQRAVSTRPYWDDVDFGYRAHLSGVRFYRCSRAVAEHWDYALANLPTAARRWQHASRAAVLLFQKHPGLQAQLPMFADKAPIAWRRDRPRMLARKLLRRSASSTPVLAGLERTASLLERRWPVPALLRPLYRWIIGAQIYRGYQQGLKDMT